jgi:hypothetical protein
VRGPCDGRQMDAAVNVDAPVIIDGIGLCSSAVTGPHFPPARPQAPWRNSQARMGATPLDNARLRRARKRERWRVILAVSAALCLETPGRLR